MEAGKLIFTDVGDDKETGRPCIVCAMPVYGKYGELLAVAGSDFFLTKIQEGTVASYRAANSRYKPIIAIILTIELILMLVLVTRQGRRIVKPLNSITKRISEIQGSDMEFEMEDAYRTGDEIEVLANAFSDLTHKTAEYVEQVRKVSAEKAFRPPCS